MKRVLFVVAESQGAELPLLVTENIKEVARFIGKSLETTKWYFTPTGQKRRADSELFSKKLHLPMRFEKVVLEDEDD